MIDEKIRVRVTETGHTMDVVVLSKRPDRIEIVLGEGVHSVKCALTPTRTGKAYAGTVMGREIVYERRSVMNFVCPSHTSRKGGCYGGQEGTG
jgi:hypothetical protein